VLIDANEVDAGKTVDADLCIIGSGAAGLTMAQAFLREGVSVLVLEGGGLVADASSHALYLSIRNLGRDYPQLYASRLRYFGGTTNHWGGHCVPLRGINFERLPWSPYTGWPFSLADLQPYYRRAEDLLGLDRASVDPETVASLLGERLFPFDKTCLQTQVSRYHAVRFGERFRADMERSENVTVMLNANAVSIDSHQDGSRVEGISVKTLEGSAFSVRAKAYVLAAGGIENPRLLLASRSVHREGLGNANDIVGRFFMEHIWYPSGEIVPADPGHLMKLYTEEIPTGEIAYRAHLVLPEEVVKKAQIPDFRCEIAADRILPHGEAVRSARLLRDSVENGEWPDHLGTHVLNIIRDPGAVVSAMSGGHLKGYRLLNNVEQAPNPQSRIALSDEKDVLGVPIATIDWRLSDVDERGIRFAHQCIAREVGRSGIGRMLVDLPDNEAEILPGANGDYHHIGTTRMHDNPRLGVVDKDCKVHGLANLFVAGSSVFPTGGFANPTFTIVALAIRLGDHIKMLLEAEG